MNVQNHSFHEQRIRIPIDELLAGLTNHSDDCKGWCGSVLYKMKIPLQSNFIIGEFEDKILINGKFKIVLEGKYKIGGETSVT